LIVSLPDSAQKLFPGVVFSGERNINKVYLTFDDGPIPEVTLPILELLKEHKAIATFFEVGENVFRYPEVHDRILKEGHQVANHTFNHLSGWKTKSKEYLENVEKANKLIKSDYFRPPYGRMTPKQFNGLKKASYKIIYWDILSRDYDKTVSQEECLNNILSNLQNGSIILLHDSLKAEKNVLAVLPKVLETIKQKGFEFGRIDEI
jgi:peptidoglycan/xylan/chitin deacetylase (PgdA/CDA1 family)